MGLEPPLSPCGQPRHARRAHRRLQAHRALPRGRPRPALQLCPVLPSRPWTLLVPGDPVARWDPSLLGHHCDQRRPSRPRGLARRPCRPCPACPALLRARPLRGAPWDQVCRGHPWGHGTPLGPAHLCHPLSPGLLGSRGALGTRWDPGPPGAQAALAVLGALEGPAAPQCPGRQRAQGGRGRPSRRLCRPLLAPLCSQWVP